MHYMNDTYELAMKLCGLDPENDEQFSAFEQEGEQMLWDKYEINEENFEKLVKDLLPYTHMAKSPLTDKMLVGFADHEKGMYLLKEEV